MRRAKSGVCLLAVGLWFVLSVPIRVEAQPTHTVVLDNFDGSYTNMNPDGTPTVVYYPSTATPANWRWHYVGYGDPGAGDRNTTTFYTSPASWHFFLKQNANHIDDFLNPSPDLDNQGPIIATRFNRSGWEPRTFDQVIADLSEPKIDWSQVVRFAVNVRANWDTSLTPSFSEIRQGIFVLKYHGGTVQNVNDFVVQPDHPGERDTWQEATIEVLGKATNDRFDFGVFGSVTFTATPTTAPSPALDFYFDNLRVLYTPLRLENVSATSPINEGSMTTLSGDIPYASAMSGSFKITVDWGDGTTPEVFTYPEGTTSFSEQHQYLDDNPSGDPANVYTIMVTLTDDEGSGMAQTQVTVNNVPPTLSDVSAMSTGGTNVLLSGKISDPGTQDSFTLQVDWGDGNIEMFSYPAGTTMFSESHAYANSAIGTIGLKLTDDDTGTNAAEVNINWAVKAPAASSLGLLVLCFVLGMLGARMVARRSGTVG